jgi:phage portal protein BeeE
MTKAYEIHNPDFCDMTLEQQIEAGCCDWCVEGFSGHKYYGHSPVAAHQNAAMYFYK